MPSKPRVQKRLYYKIGDACKALDIQPYVLRYWETEFSALSPTKSRSGQRVYSEKELAVIRRIKELLYEEGYTIAGAKKKLETELASGSLAVEGEDEAEAAPERGAEAAEPSGEARTDSQAAAAASPSTEAPKPARAERSARADRQRASQEPAPAPPDPGEPPVQQPLLLDTRAAQQVESMRKGIQQALTEARGILALLAKSPQQ